MQSFSGIWALICVWEGRWSILIELVKRQRRKPLFTLLIICAQVQQPEAPQKNTKFWLREREGEEEKKRKKNLIILTFLCLLASLPAAAEHFVAQKVYSMTISLRPKNRGERAKHKKWLVLYKIPVMKESFLLLSPPAPPSLSPPPPPPLVKIFFLQRRRGATEKSGWHGRLVNCWLRAGRQRASSMLAHSRWGARSKRSACAG